MKEIKIVATEFYYKCPCWLTEDVSIQLVKVTGLCTAAEVDTLLYGLLGFNDIPLSINPAESLIALMQEMKENNVAMSGGLLFQEDEKVITPSCCCGLEQWKEIVDDIKAKKRPWLGHDPWGTCIYEEDKTIVCSDDISILQEKNKDKVAASEEIEIVKIIYTDKELEVLFHQIETDMQEFIQGPLKKRILELAPEIAEEFCDAWSFYFGSVVKDDM